MARHPGKGLLARLFGRGRDLREAERRSEERSVFLHSERADGIGYVADLSLKGLYVRSELEVAAGETLRATLPSPDGDLVEISGVVSRVAAGGFALQIREASAGYAELVGADGGEPKP